MRGFLIDAVLLCATLVLAQGCGTRQPATQSVHAEGGQSALTRSGALGQSGTRPGYVIVTDVAESEPYYAAVRLLQAYRSAQVVHFPTGNVAEALAPLRLARPAFVAVVVKPETLDINFAYDVLEMSAKVDNDPFVDFAYGFITGATATDAVALVARTIVAEAARPPGRRRRLFAFGPSSVPQADMGNAFKWLPTWQSTRVAHKPGRFPQTNFVDIARADVIRFWGHGTPRGIDDSVSHADLKTLDVHAVVFAGPCFSATTKRYYTSATCHDVRREQTVVTDQSLALTFLAQGAPAYLGALQEDRCLSAGQEMEHALSSGEPLSMTVKRTYDLIVMAQTNAEMRFLRFRAGKALPPCESTGQQVRLGAARILLGDPAFSPFADTATQVLDISSHSVSSGLEIVAAIVEPRARNLFVNAFRSDLCECCDTDNDTLYVRTRLPAAMGTIVGVRSVALPPDLEKYAHDDDVAWEEEQWQDERFLHLQIDFEHGALQDATNATVRFVMDVTGVDD